MNRLILFLTICCVITLTTATPMILAQQETGVTAEAIGQANLRAEPGVGSAQVGEIFAGLRYPVVGRSEFYPWILLGDPTTSQPIGWVFKDLVNVQGDINLVPFSTIEIGEQTATPTPQLPVVTLPPEITQTATPPGASAATLPPLPNTSVTGVVNGEINIRYGPGPDYNRIGVAQAGERFVITARHTQVPWLRVLYTDSPNGFGWVYEPLLEIEGNIYELPSVSRTDLNLPTLTPTQPVFQAVNSQDGTPISLSEEFQTLGDRIWNMTLRAGFDPETSRFGAFFLLDLQTGESLTFGNEVAFSGMSINKIAILAQIYNILGGQPNASEARTIASMMICSENSSSNNVLTMIGGGDDYLGAQNVTAFLRDIGLENTFIVAPFHIEGVSTPQPVRLPITDADQIKANPDGTNQLTVNEIGSLLGNIYQCAYDESGEFLENESVDSLTPADCRSMIRVMSENHIGELIEAGVPAGTTVAHKHGWIDDVHGDAGIVFTPGGNYVLVMALYNPVWLDYLESFPLMGEISREVYNYYNPNTPMDAIRGEDVPEECVMPVDLIDDLMTAR